MFKKIALFLFMVTMPGAATYETQALSTKPTVWYVFDALCGWCYGFSPVVEQMAAKYGNKAEFKVISGGLRLGADVGPLDVVAPYVKTAYKDVERATGVKFGPGFVDVTLKEGKCIANSLPAAQCLSVFRARFPEKQLKYAGELHKAMYWDGAWPEDIDAFAVKADKLGYPKEEFLKAVKDPQSIKMAEADFMQAKRFGATGFPTVLVQEGTKLTVIARGFVPASEFESKLVKFINK